MAHFIPSTSSGLVMVRVDSASCIIFTFSLHTPCTSGASFSCDTPFLGRLNQETRTCGFIWRVLAAVTRLASVDQHSAKTMGSGTRTTDSWVAGQATFQPFPTNLSSPLPLSASSSPSLPFPPPPHFFHQRRDVIHENPQLQRRVTFHNLTQCILQHNAQQQATPLGILAKWP